MKLTPAFQKAVYNLPAAQKNQILFKLLSDNQEFAEKLEFQLLSTLTVVELRERLFQTLDDALQAKMYIYTPNQLLMFMRELYKKVESHTQLTSDTYGEVDLNIYILNESLRKHSETMSTFKYKQVELWTRFAVAKTFKILLKINQLSKTEQQEINPNLVELGHHYQNSKHLSRTARHHGLNLNWFLTQKIPNKLQEIHEGIKKLGYLQSRNPVKNRVKE